MIKVTIPLDRSARIKAGIADPRTSYVAELSDEHVARLSALGRSALALLVARDCEYLTDASSRHVSIPEALKATPEAALEALEGVASAVEERNAELKRDADAQIRAALQAHSELPADSRPVYFDADGKECQEYHGRRVGRTKYAWSRGLPYVSASALEIATIALRERYERAESDVKDANTRSLREAIAAALPDALRVHGEAERKKAERKAAEAAEFEALYARLPQALRDRHEAGYAEKYEVQRAMADLMIGDHDYPAGRDMASYSYYRTAASLTDDQWNRLSELERKAPAGAKVSAELWSDDESSDLDAVDEDFEATEIAVAEIKWSRGGVEATVVIPLGE